MTSSDTETPPLADYEAANPSFRKSDVAGRMARDLAQLSETLAHIVSENLAGGAACTIRELKHPVGAGSSNETILFYADWEGPAGPTSRGLVLRIAPSDFQLFVDPRMSDQYRLYQALYRSKRVKVAEPLLFVDSNQPFGRPYIIMERLYGKVPVSFPPYNAAGFVFDATVEQRRTLWEASVDQLAQIALTPREDVAFLADTPGDGDFDAQFQSWRDLATWAKVSHYPALAELEQWLVDNMPKDPPPGLSWGDARIGNIMFNDDFSVAGVMDWEQTGLGGALIDLGWWLYFDRFHCEALGLTRLKGLGNRDETVQRWQTATGIEVRDLDWYENLAGYKVAVITARKMILEQTSLPNNNGNNNIATQQNARLRSLKPPEDFIVSP